MRVLAIGAQPGEIELACGGTLARHTQRGDAVAIVCISNGNLSHDAIPPDELAETRRDESKNAAKALGAELYWLDNSDFAIEDEPVTTMKLVEIIRAFQPDALITHSPAGDRPDHSSTHALTLRASVYTAVPQLEGSGRYTKDAAPIFEMETLSGVGFDPAEYVDITQAIDIKRAAIECHGTYLDYIKRVRGRDLVEECMVTARYRGIQCQTAYAESFRQTRRPGRLRAERLLP
ncbi:MAG: PIG-L family deacetylase [Chloroflexi bacterium]|nr:PIG-L family deacetylase [Chloroflexota bacterium]